MKIVASADWRDSIPFDTPMIAAEVAPGEATRCAGCGAGAAAFSRENLWAVKHRHPNNHAGFVRFYCAEHVPARKVEPVEPAAPAKRRAPRATANRASTPRAPSSRTATAPEDRPRPVCPTCFVQASATGVCGMCGDPVS